MKTIYEIHEELGAAELTRRLLAEAVGLCEEQPGKMYDPENKARRCFYHLDCEGNPGDGCLIGQAFFRLGVDVSQEPFYYVSQDGKVDSVPSVDKLFQQCLGHNCNSGLDADTIGRLRVLTNLQAFQDHGCTWGEAFNRCGGEA